MENIRGGFYLISNVLDVRMAVPTVISPTIKFSKADDKQVDAIHTLLGSITSGFFNPRGYYELDWVETQTSPTSSRAEPRPLQRSDWRYYILSFSGYGNDVHELLSASMLTEPYLDAFAHAYTDGEFGTGAITGWGGDTLQGVTTYEMPRRYTPQLFCEPALEKLRETYALLSRLNGDRHPGIRRAVESLKRLKRISYGTDLRVLALFSIIEMLLTHNPNDREVGDSLSHQISTKVPLLSTRFEVPLDYSTFKTDSPTAIWKKLYEYRSKIAHGDVPDFAGRLQILRDQQTSNRFLEDAVRRIVRHALTEPELVDGLKPI